MDCALYRKITALLMVMVIVTMAVAGFCRSAHASEPPGDAPYGHCAGHFDEMEQQCPDCPDDSHSGPDQCDSSCNCSCHASLAAQPIQLRYSPQIATLVAIEPIKSLPDVYLPKFVPPQIHS